MASDYEKQRRDRIEKNKSRLAELGLSSLAEELASQAQPPSNRVAATPRQNVPVRRSQRLRRNEAESLDGRERAGGEAEGGEGEDGDEEMVVARQIQDEDYAMPLVDEASSSESEDATSEDELVQTNRKQKRSSQKDDEALHSLPDEELQQAIALSLELSRGSQPSTENKTASSTKTKAKAKQMRKDLFQLPEEELDALYYTIIDGARGLSVRELQSVTASHDFTWDIAELREMISFFDTDKDGMLSLGEFRTMASRCRIIEDQ